MPHSRMTTHRPRAPTTRRAASQRAVHDSKPLDSACLRKHPRMGGAQSRANGGFYVVQPRHGGFEEAVKHVDNHPEFWDMELTNHTPQQTGTTCFFKTRKLLKTLPCPYWCVRVGHTPEPPQP